MLICFSIDIYSEWNDLGQSVYCGPENSAFREEKVREGSGMKGWAEGDPGWFGTTASTFSRKVAVGG